MRFCASVRRLKRCAPKVRRKWDRFVPKLPALVVTPVCRPHNLPRIVAEKRQRTALPPPHPRGSPPHPRGTPAHPRTPRPTGGGNRIAPVSPIPTRSTPEPFAACDGETLQRGLLSIFFCISGMGYGAPTSGGPTTFLRDLKMARSRRSLTASVSRRLKDREPPTPANDEVSFRCLGPGSSGHESVG